MSQDLDSIQATQVQEFASEMAATFQPLNEGQDLSQLRVDFMEDHKKKKAQTYAHIQEIEDRLMRIRPEEELALAQVRQDLFQAMEEFRKQAPGGSLPTQREWEWKDIESSINTVQTQWKRSHSESGVSRTISCLRKMCHGLQKHSAILKLMPSENNYVSIISGAVSMIIQAAATHVEVTEAFAQGVIEINDAVSGIQTQIYDSDTLKLLVMRLYSHIFAYLQKFMKWHTDPRRTRLFKSFNESLKPGLQEDIRKIKDTCTTLTRLIQNHISGDVKITKLLVGHQNANIEHLLRLHEEDSRDTKLRDAAYKALLERNSDDLQISLARMMQQFSEILREAISGAAMSSLLLHQAQNHNENKRLSLSNVNVPYELSEEVEPCNVEHQDVHNRWTDVQLFTAHFEDFYDKINIYPFIDIPETLMDNPVVVSRLGAFTTSMSSQLLYLFDEPSPSDHPNFLQEAIGAYILHAREQRIPTVSYFCTLPHGKPPKNRTRESIELCAAMYSLLKQLIDLLPSNFVARKDLFEAEALKGLNGKLTTWDPALDLLTELIECLRLPLLLVVIDGLDHVEDDRHSNTYAKATTLERRLKSIVEAQGRDRIVKVLFSTAGSSYVLSSQLKDADTMCCRETSSAHSPRAMFKLGY